MASPLSEPRPRCRATHQVVPLVALSVTLTGCYRAVPVDGAGALAARSVRVALTEAGTQRVASVLGPYIVAIEGRAEPGGGDTLVVRVRRAFHQAGIDESRPGDPVRLAPGDVASVGARRLSVWRTALVAALVAGVGVLLPGLFGSDGGSSGAPGSPPTPP